MNGQCPHPSDSPTIISMRLQGTVIEESHFEDEDDNLTSQTWQEIAEDHMNFVIFERLVEEFNVVEPNNQDKLPDQLLEVANTILYISFGIKVIYTNLSLLTYSYNQTFFSL
jgi:hypothetical protein